MVIGFQNNADNIFCLSGSQDSVLFFDRCDSSTHLRPGQLVEGIQTASIVVDLLRRRLIFLARQLILANVKVSTKQSWGGSVGYPNSWMVYKEKSFQKSING